MVFLFPPRDAAALRLRRALLASLLLHGVLALPLGVWLRPPVPPAAPPRLELQLALPAHDPVQELTTTPATALAPPPAAVPAAGHSVPPAPTFQPKPSPQPAPTLRGRALASATAALSEQLLYPREAVERGLEGRVILLLHLDGTGRVEQVAVAASSGHAVLDAAALQAAGRLAGVGGAVGLPRQVLLPVDFRLD